MKETMQAPCGFCLHGLLMSVYGDILYTTG